MQLKVSVFEYLNQKVMYIQDVNYYFGIRNDYDIKFGDYELHKEEVLAIAKENDPEEYEVFINTSIEERINKINTYDIDKVKEESSHGQFTLCLHPSRKCNLNCKYCFKESDYLGDEELTFEVAKDAIDFLMDKYAPCASKYVIDLSGSGEPLLQLDLIKQIADYCRQKRNETCKKTEVMFSSNFTLLTPEVADYIDNDSIIFIGTSIDGDKITNDSNREYGNGKGTYDDVVKGIKMFKNKKPGLAVTVTPLNQNVDLIYDHLYHLPNVDCISMRFIRCYDGSKYDFNNFDVKYLLSRYEKLCKNILRNLENNNFDYLVKIINGADVFGNLIAQNLFKGVNIVYKCDAGKNRIAVNYQGEIFSCSVMMGNSDFRIGNIDSGIDRELQQKCWSVSKRTNTNCISCEYNHICGGECYANSYLKYNDMHTNIDKKCQINIELNKMSIAFIEYIKNNLSNIFNRFVSFIFKVQNYSLTDSAVWAVMDFLSCKGITSDYDVINSQLKISDFGVRPQDIVNCLNLYNLDVNAYLLESSKEAEILKFPSISLANKNDMGKFVYYININKTEKDLIFKTLETPISNYNRISIEDYIKNISNIVIF